MWDSSSDTDDQVLPTAPVRKTFAKTTPSTKLTNSQKDSSLSGSQLSKLSNKKKPSVQTFGSSLAVSDDSLDSDSSGGSISKILSSQAPTPKPRSSLAGKKDTRIGLPSEKEPVIQPKSQRDLRLVKRQSGGKTTGSHRSSHESLASAGRFKGTDKGHQYSKRDEKVNLGEFLTKDSQVRQSREKEVRSRQSSFSSLKGACGGRSSIEDGVEESRRGLTALKVNEGNTERPRSGLLRSAHFSSDKSSTKGSQHPKKIHGILPSSSDDNSDDDSKEKLPSVKRYVPPSERFISNTSTQRPETVPTHSVSGVERQQRVIIEQGKGKRAQTPTQNRDSADGVRMDQKPFRNNNEDSSNWRDRGNRDNGPRRNWRPRENSHGRNEDVSNWRDHGNAGDGPRHNWRPRENNNGNPANRHNGRNIVDEPHRGVGQDRRGQGDVGENRQGFGRRPPPPHRQQHQEEGVRGQNVPPLPPPHHVRHAEGGENGGNNRQPRRHQPPGLRPLEANLSFTRLRELRSKDPPQVVGALSYSMEGLSKLLKNEDKLTSDREMMRLLLSCLAKVALCQSMPTQSSQILNQVRRSEFLRILGTFLTLNSTNAQLREVPHIIGESADLLKAIVMFFPSHIHDVLMVHAFIEVAQKQVKQRGSELSQDILQKVQDLEMAKDAALESLQNSKARARGDIVDEDALEPPNDYREISVFPTMKDIGNEEKPFLRKNKEVGGYVSVDHYLDVQFRLLREDFVCPLREGISQYLAMVAAPHRGKKLQDIRVYHNVHILRAVCLQSGLGYRLSFDVSGLKRVRWEVSKRLIYGSLVCLSADNFKTLFFATVANREPADLKEGVVDVTFEHDLQEVFAISPETTFIMAETTAFFEAYRHVLLGLQRINVNNLPFQRYIVNCEKVVREPLYLVGNQRPSQTYDLRPLVDESVKLREDRTLAVQGRQVAYDFSSESQLVNSVDILRREEWPDPSLLKLDTSQFEALHRALTKEFSVIQGPPGTGKTYLGLKIVKALLHNRTAWDPQMNSCMLIVCYTNHALDQFLEGVASFFDGRVVRVGSRCKSEKLEQYSLNNLRMSMRRLQRDEVDRDFWEFSRLRFQEHEHMDNLKKEVDTMGLKIESAKREILHEDMLMPHMMTRHYDRLQDIKGYLQMIQQEQFVQQGQKKKNVCCIPEWLGIGAMLQNTQVTAQDLDMLDQELGEDDLMIEGEIQALEQQNRLDVEDPSFFGRDGRKNKEKERKRELAAERSSYLALDISKLDHGLDEQEQSQQAGGGNGGFQIPKQQWKKLKRKLRRNVEQGDRMTEAQERQVRDLWELDMPDRWRLYRRWTHKLCEHFQMQLRERERLYDEMAKRHKETLMQQDKHILKTATIIAMTTTGAARYQSVMQEVKPKVIVVEEAAEVLEGHVITTLNQDCEHLILIGDHKQLRPNPNVFALARKYNLELSLFERMINNGVKCDTLGWQHRMRPEIAALVESIYPELKNHPSVENYEPIKGMSTNLFFISHSQWETHDAETKSHSNWYEAQYLAGLCRYLLKQGYNPARITVLTTYSGQLFQLRKLMPKKSDFDGVRVTVVDNFQGEENDIILLSLVRSNEDGNIGFLKIENRVCVALSRAKMGLYVIGNFELLSAQSDLWQYITAGLKEKGLIGENLTLKCQNHPRDKGLVIKTPEDFENAPEGGCMKPCTARLKCGHVCTRLCHPYDQDHVEYRCMKKCEKKMNCEFQHPCERLCYQKCGECEVQVPKKVPRCGHTQWMHCSVVPEDFVCREKCEAVLPCGHECGDECGQKHRCYEKVVHSFPCGHTAEVYCGDRDNSCPLPCDKQLSCGHKCAGTCRDCHGGRLHQRCGSRCTKILVCGHECTDTCSNCPPCDEKCENSCVHSSCQKRCGLQCVPCMEPCAWQCHHHKCNKLCSEACDRPRCTEPCPELLECDHPCIGLCGEPCPKLCRICHNKQVTDIFFGTEDEPDARFVQLEDCEHIVEVSAMDTWMTTTTSDREDSIQLKTCPFCKTTIRRSLRYGAIIKQQLKDIETVKTRMLGNAYQRINILAELQQQIEDETESKYTDMKQNIMDAVDKETEGGVVAMKNQMQFLDETKKLRNFKQEKRIPSSSFIDALDKFESWICTPRLVFSEQEEHDAQTEILRLRHWLVLAGYERLAIMKDGRLHSRVAYPVKNMLRKMVEGQMYPKSQQDNNVEMLNQLKEMYPDTGLGISDEERVMIVNAMELALGQWFKCPQGHIYAIGDCGGATMESRCPECKSLIGGGGHRVRDDNALASEMDGATRPAWPGQTNIRNFMNIRLDDLL